MSEETAKRKTDHIRIALNNNVQSKNATAGFEDVSFVHRALPEVDRKDIDLSTRVFGHNFAAPVIVGAITGGTIEAEKINATIAEAVEELGLGMGVGSQRAAIDDKKLERTFAIARKKAPKAFLIANIGGVQLMNGYGLKEVKRAVEMIDADALAIHLNALQETAQPEGQTNFRGILERINEIADKLDKPIIAKETGAGISSDEAKKLEAVGVKGIDVSGAGGTSFAAVEHYRFRHGLGTVFWDWGIPTVASIVEVSQSVKIPLIASGGVRSGVDAAKCLSLGASLTSFSQPILQSAVKGTERTCLKLSLMMDELRNAMFLVGAGSVEQLRRAPLVVTGKTSEWLRARGFRPESYAQR
ncbi:MAG TPA: type 2 isopentenyl-diphosphate Delta-isomerase [Candidatus Eisenbacteria bacterium]|nr:type 2 isopentenyl-diphosphate Delta-isomerase [Candidatus Eisenbacteria bacterium]